MNPPTISTRPILMSTLPRRQWASAPETEAATTWLASVATATTGVTPMKISSGVIRKPPPTPNIPDKIPTPPPSPSSSKAFSEISAMGK